MIPQWYLIQKRSIFFHFHRILPYCNRDSEYLVLPFPDTLAACFGCLSILCFENGFRYQMTPLKQISMSVTPDHCAASELLCGFRIILSFSPGQTEWFHLISFPQNSTFSHQKYVLLWAETHTDPLKLCFLYKFSSSL